jgi:hypothetical protein
MQVYSNPEMESDPCALPDVEVFYMTAEEYVLQDEDLCWEARKKFPLASMNSKEREKAIEWAVDESGAAGGWFYWYCQPGCLPDSSPEGPFPTADAAKQAAQESASETC